MAKSITDSDSIPTDVDRQNAKEMFMHDGSLDVDKMAHTVARLHRKESLQQGTIAEMSQTLEQVQGEVGNLTTEFKDHCSEFREHRDQVEYCLRGDKLGAYGGMISEQQRQGGLLEEVYEHVTKKDATTKKTPRSGSDPFVERMKGVILFAAWGITTLLALLAIIW